jgi:cell division protein FtsL
MINKGRIQIQGRFMKEWGSEEFPMLIELINNPDLMKSNTAKNLNNFTAKTLSQRTTNQQTPANSRQPDHDHPILLDSSINHSPKERLLINTVKTNLATLEADFIGFKQKTNKNITELNTTIFEKDIQIKNLENEITNLKRGY